MHNSVLEVAINGEIDHHNARAFRSQIDEKLYLYRPKKVNLDVSGVSFMDSSGLGLILGRFTLARELGGELRIVNPKSICREDSRPCRNLQTHPDRQAVNLTNILIYRHTMR